MQRTDLFMTTAETSWWSLNSNHKQMGTFDDICSYEYFICFNDPNRSVCIVKLSPFSTYMLLKPLKIAAEVTMSVFNKGQGSRCVHQNAFRGIRLNLMESCLLLRLPFLIMARKAQEFTIRMSPPWFNYWRRHSVFSTIFFCTSGMISPAFLCSVFVSTI